MINFSDRRRFTDAGDLGQQGRREIVAKYADEALMSRCLSSHLMPAPGQTYEKAKRRMDATEKEVFETLTGEDTNNVTHAAMIAYQMSPTLRSSLRGR